MRKTKLLLLSLLGLAFIPAAHSISRIPELVAGDITVQDDLVVQDDLTVNGTITGNLTGDVTGNATTATSATSATTAGALAADPADCSAGEFAHTIASDGDLSCAKVKGSDLDTGAFDDISPATTKGDLIVHDGSNNVRLPACSDGEVMIADSNEALGYTCGTPASVGGNLPSLVDNLGLSVSAGSGAMTVALKQSNGSSDPDVGDDSVRVAFRSTSATSGGYTIQSYASATSLTIPSGATFGYGNGADARVWVYAIYDGSNLELAASADFFDERALHSTTAIGTGSDSRGVLYSTNARTDCAIRLIGEFVVNSITTAGTWTTPSRVSVSPDLSVYGVYGVSEYLESVVGSSALPTSTQWGDKTSLLLTPGEWDLTGVVNFGAGGGTVSWVQIAITSTSGNSTSGMTVGHNRAQGLGPTSSADVTLIVPSYRVVVTTPTTYYLKHWATHTGGSPGSSGARLSARRIR